MPKNGVKSKSHVSDSESSSDTTTTDSVKMYMIQQKHHRRRKSHKKNCSDSDSDTYKKHDKEKKCDHHEKKYDHHEKKMVYTIYLQMLLHQNLHN
jgi:hypothetical protein